MTIKALILEDDPLQLRLFSHMLSSSVNCQYEVAANGTQALSLLQSDFTPDIIFCDLEMPDMDGIEFIRSTADIGQHFFISIVSSANSDVIASVMKMGEACGVNMLEPISKPITRAKLAQVIESLRAANEQRKNYPSKSDEHSAQQLKQALDEGQFEPFFQPQIDAKTLRVEGVEALIRWQHPQLGLLSPYRFLEDLIAKGLSWEVTLVMLEKSIALASQWRQQEHSFNLSVNIDPDNLSEPHFTEKVLQILERHNFPASRLTIEITERDHNTSQAKVLENLSRLRIKGVLISIDDFGTGSASLTSLIDGPFTELKIDRYFVQRMVQSKRHLSAVDFALKLASSLELKTVAEGVETKAQMDKLHQLGCDSYQGYRFSEPLPAASFIAWYQDYRRQSMQKFALA